MLFAIKLANSGEPPCFLMPACFDHGTGHTWSPLGMPDRARKFTSAGEAVLCCEGLPFACEVVALPGTGREYIAPVVPNGKAR